MPSQAFSHRAAAEAGVEQVWSALQDPETWKEIGGVSAISNPSFDGMGLTGYEFIVAVAGKGYRGRARRVEAVPGGRMVMAIDTDQLDGCIAVDLDPRGRETGVGVEMQISSRGFMAGLLFSVIANAVSNGFDEAVERFVTSLESP